MRQFMQAETRFSMIARRDPERYRKLVDQAQQRAEEHYSIYQQLAAVVPTPRDATESS
jgi:hypothetical protein